MTAAALPEYRIDGGLSGHAETVTRTLFNATRRPAPALASDGGPHRLNPGRFQLMGTTVTAERNIAFLKDVAGGKSRVVRQGDEIDGVRVVSVQPDRVKLALGDDSEELVLQVAHGPEDDACGCAAAAGSACAGRRRRDAGARCRPSPCTGGCCAECRWGTTAAGHPASPPRGACRRQHGNADATSGQGSDASVQGGRNRNR